MSVEVTPAQKYRNSLFFFKRQTTKYKTTDIITGKQEETCIHNCLLVALCSSNMLVYVRDGSAKTSVQAATLR